MEHRTHKIALGFYGQPRYTHIKAITQNLKLFFQNHEITVFGFFWIPSETLPLQSTWNKTRNWLSPSFQEDLKVAWPNSYLQFHQQKDFRLKSSNLHGLLSTRFFNSNENISEQNLFNLISQLYSIEKVSLMIQQHEIDRKKQYDFIAITRPDTIFRSRTRLYGLDLDSINIDDAHGRFPDNLVIYPRSKFSSIQTYTHIHQLVHYVRFPVAESFKESLIFLDDLNAKIVTHPWQVTLFGRKAGVIPNFAESQRLRWNSKVPHRLFNANR